MTEKTPNFRNFTSSSIFLCVNLVAFVVFIFSNKIYHLLGGNLGPINYDLVSSSSYFIYLSVIFFTYFLLSLNGRSISSNDYVIKFPYMLHIILLGVEFSFSTYVTGGASSTEHARELYAIRTENLGHIKILTLFLYMTTMLLGASLAKSNFRDFKILTLVAFTILLFLFKDFVIGSRGSAINVITFLFGGFTFVKPFKFKNILKFRYILIAVGIFFVILVLTFRRGAGSGVAAVTDSLLYKFSVNVYIALVYLSEDIDVRIFSNGMYTNWSSLRGLPNIDEFLSKVHLFNSLPDFFNTYIKAFFDYEAGSVYFRVFGESPWNSVNYMLRFLIFDTPGMIFLSSVILVYIFLSRLSMPLMFFVHCSLVYFAALSFTGCSLIEIPFVLVVVFAPLFGSVFRTHVNA